jgi:uncharacterized repeat protein (TIGR01451 family)
VITDYLGSGGKMLLSGQDVAYWDGGGIWILERYYVDYMHSAYWSDDAPSRQVVCRDDSALGGLTLSIQGGDGADNQRWPDEIQVYHPDYASLACNYVGGEGAVIQAGLCRPHRALNLGFGFEAIDNPADRAQFMAHALEWFATPRPTADIELIRKTDALQIAPPGHAVTHTARLRNLGEVGSGDVIQIDVSGYEWQTEVLISSVDLDACEATSVDIRVDIPASATWNSFDAMTVTARSTVSPTVSRTLVFTTRVLAPVLLVDDDRWIDQEQAYEDALIAAGVPFDRWEVTEIFGKGSPPAEVLAWYPIVLWFTSYDWFDPIHLSEAERLVSYLDHGGRFFLSSQSALGRSADSELARDYFGVIDVSYVLSQTTVAGVPGHVLADGLGPVALDYPFTNWSDSILPAPGTEVAFRGQHGQPGAVTREEACSGSQQACRWRTALFAFPVEAIPEETRTTLMSRLVGWLSWLGGSRFEAGQRVAQVGDTVAYTLTLRNDGLDIVSGGAMSNTLPAGTVLIDGPHGGADYEAQSRRVFWSGDLAPAAAVTITYRLSLTDGLVGSLVRNTADIVLGDQGLRFQRHADVYLSAADLSASSLAMAQGDVSQAPATVKASSQVSVTLVVRNDGLADASDVNVNNPLPWTLRLITGTLSSGGVGTPIELPKENRVRWQGDVAAGEPVTLTYRAVAPSVLEEGTWVYNAARLEPGLGGAWERGGWLFVEPKRFYFPMVLKKG